MNGGAAVVQPLADPLLHLLPGKPLLGIGVKALRRLAPGRLSGRAA